MLRRIAVALLTVILVTGSVMADVEIVDYRIDKTNNIFSLRYDYTDYSDVTIIAYDVSQIENPSVNQKYIDEETTPIIGIWQEYGDGQFDLSIKPDYSGKLLVIVGSEDKTSARILIQVSDGVVESITIPDYIWGEVDANGAERVLEKDETITMEQDATLMNAIVNASNGSFTIGTTNVSGRVTFTADGKIIADAGDTITLEAVGESGTKTLGFVCGQYYETPADERMMVISVAGGHFKKTFKTAGLVGNFMFGAIVQNVPENIQASDFTVSIENVINISPETPVVTPNDYNNVRDFGEWFGES